VVVIVVVFISHVKLISNSNYENFSLLLTEEIDDEFKPERNMTYPCIVNTRYRSLGSVENEKRCQIGGVWCHDYHRKAGPDHTKHSSTETAWRSWTSSAIINPHLFTPIITNGRNLNYFYFHTTMEPLISGPFSQHFQVMTVYWSKMLLLTGQCLVLMLSFGVNPLTHKLQHKNFQRGARVWLTARKAAAIAASYNVLKMNSIYLRYNSCTA